MPLSEVRSSRSWQEAINLGPNLVLLAEQLPASEQMGLCWQLQKLMVELPAAIAVDVMQTGNTARRLPALRLVASLDLIEKIYPALDTASVRDSVEALVDRLQTDSFDDLTPAAGPAPVVTADATPATVAPSVPVGPAASIPVIPEPASPVAVTPAAPTPEPADVEPRTIPVAVEEADEVAQENHVRTDSV